MLSQTIKLSRAESRVHLQNMASASTEQKASGFTLIELLIMIQNNRLTAQANSFKAALQYARATALSQNTSIQVCPIGAVNSTNCGSQWSAGWMIVVPGTTLLQSNRRGTKDANLGSGVTSVNFSARGFVSAQSAFTICDARGASVAKAIQVETTGSIQIAPVPGKTLGGAAITCP